MRNVSIATIVLLGSMALAAPSDTDLGLHSDGGNWKFQRAGGGAGLPRVLLIGDSIMNGYRGRVISALKGKAAVDYWSTPLHLKSEHLHHDLRRVLEQGPYDVVHFNIGLHGWTPGRIPKGEYEPALRAYVEILRGHSASARFVWGSTTQITVKRKPTALDPVHNTTIMNRNVIAAKVMADHNIAINDLYGLMSDKLRMGRGDKYHWNDQAKALMAKQVVSTIKDALTAKPVELFVERK